MAKSKKGLVPKEMRRPAGENDFTYIVNCSTLALATIKMKDKLVETGKDAKGNSLKIANGRDLMEGNIQSIRAFDGSRSVDTDIQIGE